MNVVSKLALVVPLFGTLACVDVTAAEIPTPLSSHAPKQPCGADQETTPQTGKPADQLLMPAEQYGAILKEYDSAAQEFRKALGAAKTDAERRKILQTKSPDAQGFAKRLIALARAHPDDPVAVDAFVWICTNVPQTSAGPNATSHIISEAQDALALLYKHYLRSDKLVPVCRMGRHYQNLRNPLMEKFLRDALEQSPHPSVQAQSCLSLALIAADRARAAAEIRRRGRDSDYYRRLQQFHDSQEIQRITSTNPDEYQRKAEQLLRRLIQDFAPLPVYGEKTTFGEKAKALLAQMHELVVGKPAPEIEGDDIEGNYLKLSDYRGRVVVLIFWGTWCAQCIKQVPQERALVEKYKEEPFVLLGINSDDKGEELRNALRKHQITWRSWRDGREGPIARRWGVTGWPTTYILDDKGIIRYKNVRDQEMVQAVGELLKEVEAKEKP